MNGSTLTLALAAVLAAASLTQRGSAARGCPPDALIFYHGAHRWEGPPSVVEHRKGHAEHGPGIYLTTSWETANKYAKGGGSVYRIGLDSSIRFAEDVQIRVADARAFVKNLPRLRGKVDVLASLDRIEAQRGPMMPANYLVNTFVNQGAASGQGGPPLAAFLVQHGVDASLVSHSADEDWVVVFNPDKVCMVERLASAQVSRQGFAFSLPKVSRSRVPGGSAARPALTPGLRQVSGETFYWSTDRLVSPGFEVPQAVPRDTPVEDVFERVRQRAAPQAPSRLRCVYVCPKLGRGFCSGRRHEHVYKVKVWGKVFTTDGGFWTEAVFRPSHAEGFAEEYWSPRGDVMINHAEETLVEGRVVVVSKASTGHQGSRAAPKLAVQDGADWRALGERVKAWTDTNASYDMLDATPSTAGGTWLAGGCRVLASGLVKAYPDLRLAGLFNGEGRLQHVLAATPGGSFLDADGLSTHEALVRRWSEEELVVGPVRLGPVTKDALTRSEIPAAPSLSARIANLFRSGSRAARKPKPTTLSDLKVRKPTPRGSGVG